MIEQVVVVEKKCNVLCLELREETSEYIYVYIYIQI